jgi:hypothetical protein
MEMAGASLAPVKHPAAEAAVVTWLKQRLHALGPEGRSNADEDWRKAQSDLDRAISRRRFRDLRRSIFPPEKLTVGQLALKKSPAEIAKKEIATEAAISDR